MALSSGVESVGFRVWGERLRVVEFGVVRLVLLEDLHGALGHLDLEHQEVLHLAQQAHLVQGHLARKKLPPPLGPQYDPRHVPTVGSYGVAVSCERGTHVTGGFLHARYPCTRCACCAK